MSAPVAAPPVARRDRGPRHGVGANALALVGTLVLLAILSSASLAIGSRAVPLDVVWDALTGGDVPPADYAAIVALRLPRTVIGIVVGASLGASGAIIQAVTRNPLADPGILGVTAGSSFVVALAVVLLGVTAPSGYVWFAFLGALGATVVVYLVGSAGRAGGDPIQLTLAGVAVTAVLTGIVSGLRLADPRTFNAIQVWGSGSFQSRGWDVVLPVLPFLAAGIAIALALGPALNAVALGEDLATALGASLAVTRVASVVAVTLLAGGATAVAGPIAFVGLMIPHAARRIVGPDQRWIIALTLVLAPCLVLAADILARVVLWPGELPVGVVTAFLGAPVLIAIVRRKKVSTL